MKKFMAGAIGVAILWSAGITHATMISLDDSYFTQGRNQLVSEFDTAGVSVTSPGAAPVNSIAGRSVYNLPSQPNPIQQNSNRPHPNRPTPCASKSKPSSVAVPEPGTLLLLGSALLGLAVVRKSWKYRF